MSLIQCDRYLQSYRRYESIRRGVITSVIQGKWITPSVYLAEVYGASRGVFRETKQPAEVRPV